jgi:hypothetical protein
MGASYGRLSGAVSHSYGLRLYRESLSKIRTEIA